MQRWWCIGLLALILSGCGGSSGGGSSTTGAPGASTGTVSIQIGNPVVARLAFDTSSVTVSLLAGSTAFASETVKLQGGGASATFNAVPLGSYTVDVQAFNNQGILISSGSTPINVLPGQNSAQVTTSFEPQFVYATNSNAGTVSEFQFDPNTGAVQPLGTPTVAAAGAFTLITDLSGRFAYVMSELQQFASVTGQILVFTVDPTSGQLSPQPALSVFQNGFGQEPLITPDNHFLYVQTFADTATPSGWVSGFARNVQTGALTPVPGSPFLACANTFGDPLIGGVNNLTLNPLGLLFADTQVQGQTNEQLAPFTINPSNGTLSAEPVSSLSVGPSLVLASNSTMYALTGPTLAADPVVGAGLVGADSTSVTLPGEGNNVTFDPTGQFVLVADTTNSAIDVYSINPATGSLSAAPVAVGPTSPNPGVARFDPTGQFVFVAFHGASPGFSGGLNVLGWNPSNGALTPLSTLPTGNDSRTDDVAFAIPNTPATAPTPPPAASPAPTPGGSPGTLTPLQTLLGPGGPQGIVTTPDGQFLYVAGDPIQGFALKADGTIDANATPVANIIDNNGPFGAAMDPGGQFLYVADSGANQLRAFAIGSDGSLTEISGSPVALPNSPAFVATDRTGNFIFTSYGNGAGGGATAIASCSLTRATSSIQVLNNNIAVGNGPFGIVFTPNNNFMYVANEGDGTVSIFSFNAGNGSVTLKFTSPQPFGGAALAMNPTGQVLYEGQNGNDSVEGFTIAGNGNLTALAQGPVPTGGFNPGEMAIDPTGHILVASNQNVTQDTLGGTTEASFVVNSDGTLSTVPGSPFLCGLVPALEAFDPTGSFLYVGGLEDHELHSFLVTR